MKVNDEALKKGEDFLEDFYYRFSVKATELGIHRYDYKLSSLRRSELQEWENRVREFKEELKKNKILRGSSNLLEIQLLEEKANQELFRVSKESEFFSSPLAYTSDIFEGLFRVAFGSYASSSIRGKNFIERLKDIKNVRKSLEENVPFTSELEKKVAKEQLKYIRILMEEFLSYMASKNDIEMKDDIRVERVNTQNELDVMESTIENIADLMETEESLSKNIKIFESELLPLVGDMSKYLKDILDSTRNLIIRKSREIKISQSYSETLRSVLCNRKSITQEDAFSLFQFLKEDNEKKFGKTSMQLNFNFPAISDNNKTMMSKDTIFTRVVPSGIFEWRNHVSCVIPSDETLSTLALIIARDIYPGYSYMFEVRSQKENIFRKHFSNKILEEGWKVYALKESEEGLKKLLGNEFELTSLYNNYKSTLIAYVENLSLNKNMEKSDLGKMIDEDNIILNKDEFLRELIMDGGTMLMGMAGFNAIKGLKRQYEKKYKAEDFHTRLLGKSSLPLKLLRQGL